MTDIDLSNNGTPGNSPQPRTDLIEADPEVRVNSDPIFQSEIDTDKTVVVCGAGGFIGGHLVADLLRQGFDTVRAVDIKPPNQWFQKFGQADNWSLDLREKENCYRALENADHVYNLAADMGGMEVTADWIEQQMRAHREAETTSRFAVAH